MGNAQPISDAALIAQANAGDEAAFEALYVRYRDWVVALAYRTTGNRDDALDVLQETFAYFFGKFPGFEATAQLKTFLYPVVRHICFSRRRKTQPTVDLDEVVDQLPATDPAPPGGTSDLHRLLALVPELAREILLMRFVDDLSLEQIARALEIPLGTVKSRLHNAIEALRRRLRAEGQG